MTCDEGLGRAVRAVTVAMKVAATGTFGWCRVVGHTPPTMQAKATPARLAEIEVP